jgi:hypothetical protein
MKLYLGLILLFLLSCQNKHDPNIITKTFVDTTKVSKDQTLPTDSVKLAEYFVDSLNIGRKSFNKIEISKYRAADSVYVIINFYSKQNYKWVLRNNFHFRKDCVLDCDTKISDFNNDKLNDMTYISAVACRGANEVRRLFIYDKFNDKLIYIRNSDSYSNILYNHELNCIDAFSIYGGSSTDFLKISGDSLLKFASVELFLGLTVYTYDKDGQEKIIFQDSTNKSHYVRYKNFCPLRKYEEN